MLRLRPYKPSDAQTIVSWCKDEVTYRRWTSDRYDSYPITAEDMNRKYMDHNGDCTEPDNFYPLTAVDGTEIVGHLILRYVSPDQRTLRIGFVIVDDTKRGKGYGKRMLQLTLRYAFEVLMAENVNLGVFDNNPAAYHCYKAAGFRDVEVPKPEYCVVNGETWNILELEMTAMDYVNNSKGEI